MVRRFGPHTNPLNTFVNSISALSEEKALFTPHPNLSDAVNRNLIGSEIEGGVFLDRLRPHCVLQIQTRHRCYTAVMLGGSQSVDFGSSGILPGTDLGSHRRINLGRFHAETALCRSGDAPGVLSSRIFHAHCHVSRPGDPGVCRACAHLGSGSAAQLTLAIQALFRICGRPVLHR